MKSVTPSDLSPCIHVVPLGLLFVISTNVRRIDFDGSNQVTISSIRGSRYYTLDFDFRYVMTLGNASLLRYLNLGTLVDSVHLKGWTRLHVNQ